MTQRPPTPPQTTVFWQIVGGFMLLWVPGALAIAIRRNLGLEGLVTAGWCSLGLSALSVGLLWVFSSEARQACRAAGGGLGTRSTQFWILGLVITNVVLVGLVYLLYRTQHSPASAGTNVGWTHYFSLPPDRRPDFLLHFLLLSAVDKVITGPLAEELFHIGVVVGVLRRFNIPWPWIFAFDAILFVILHQSHEGGFIGVRLLLGFAAVRYFLDFLFYKTGNIAVPIAAHALNNLRVLSFNWFPLLP